MMRCNRTHAQCFIEEPATFFGFPSTLGRLPCKAAVGLTLGEELCFRASATMFQGGMAHHRPRHAFGFQSIQSHSVC